MSRICRLQVFFMIAICDICGVSYAVYVSFLAGDCALYVRSLSYLRQLKSNGEPLLIRFDNLGNGTGEVIPSFNVSAEPGTSVHVFIKATGPDGASPWFDMGTWVASGTVDGGYSASAGSQQCDWGQVDTDTVVLKKDFDSVELKITFHSRIVELQLRPLLAAISVNRSGATSKSYDFTVPVDDVNLAVPLRSQRESAEGEGWCSPTSCGMVLDYWAKVLHTPSLSVPTPVIAANVYDKVWQGTGNWSFNMAYIGSLPGIAAVAARLPSLNVIEMLLRQGIPPIVSVSYDLLKGAHRDNDPGHLMVVTGFNERGDVLLNDPYYNPCDPESGRMEVPVNLFDIAWQRSKRLVYIIAPCELFSAALCLHGEGDNA